MRLYRMELYRICRRKISWFSAGAVFLLMTPVLFRAYGQRIVMLEEFGSAAGYWNAVNILQFGSMFLSVWLTIVLAPIFAEDNAGSVRHMIISTEKGRESVYFTRVAAAFTVAALTFMGMVGSVAAICGCIYGYGGVETDVGVLFPYTTKAAPGLAAKSIAVYLCYYLLLSLGAVLMLTALIILISAFSHTVVNAVLVSLLLYLMPALLENFMQRGSMRPGYILITGQPVLLVVKRCMEESWSACWWHVAIIAAVVGGGIWCGGRKWRKKEQG